MYLILNIQYACTCAGVEAIANIGDHHFGMNDYLDEKPLKPPPPPAVTSPHHHSPPPRTTTYICILIDKLLMCTWHMCRLELCISFRSFVYSFYDSLLCLKFELFKSNFFIRWLQNSNLLTEVYVQRFSHVQKSIRWYYYDIIIIYNHIFLHFCSTISSQYSKNLPVAARSMQRKNDVLHLRIKH